MFIIDDLLLRALGLSIKPFDMIWLMELMKNYALKEKYNLKRVNNKIKENRLLFEIGEISEGDYNQKNKLLLKELERVKEIMETMSKDIRIQEGV